LSNIEPIRVGFEAIKSGKADCTLGHFGQRWPSNLINWRPFTPDTS
jgi:hypothetical protein